MLIRFLKDPDTGHIGVYTEEREGGLFLKRVAVAYRDPDGYRVQMADSPVALLVGDTQAHIVKWVAVRIG